MNQQYQTEFGSFWWHPDPADCDHANNNACPACDFDGYYQAHIPSAVEREQP